MMTTAIIVNNGQVLSLKVDVVNEDEETNRLDLVVSGAVVSVPSNNTIILKQRGMDDNSYNQMVKAITNALVSDEGTITNYNPNNKSIVKNKRLIK